MYWVAKLSGLYPLFWIAQPVPSRYTEYPIPTVLDHTAWTEPLHRVPNIHSSGSPNMYESLHWVSWNHTSGSPDQYWFVTLSDENSSGSPNMYRGSKQSARNPRLWIAQPVPSRYTESPIPTPMDRPASTDTPHSVPDTHYSGSHDFYRVATLSAIYPLLWIAQPVPSSDTECPTHNTLNRLEGSDSRNWVPCTPSSG